jgi:Rieske Fe-S protein
MSDSATPPQPSRRTLLHQWLGLVLTGLGTAALAVPVVGYLLGPLIRRKPDGWVGLGRVDDFPVNQTRVVDFLNPVHQKLDGATGKTAAYVRRLEGADLGVQVSALVRGGGSVRVDRVIEGVQTELQAGDLLVKIGGTDTRTLAEFNTVLAGLKPGATATVTVVRGGRAQLVQAPLLDRFLVLAVNCTHLGCPVSWFPAAGLFLCPCHGGVYYEDGQRASGPPPHGLYRYDYRVDNRQLQILAGHLPTLNHPLTPGRQRTG